MDSQPVTAKYLIVQASAFGKNLHFVSVEPSVTHTEASWPVMIFGVTVFKLTQINIEMSN